LREGFAGRIAGVASRLPLCFHGGFPRGSLSEFRIARLLLGLQAGLTSGSPMTRADWPKGAPRKRRRYVG
jgi:hypothetical protein